MRKSILYITILILSVTSIQAQNMKFGHVSPEDIMENMPGFDTAQAAMIRYQNSFQTDGQMMVKEFQQKQQEFQNNLPSYSEAVRKIKEEELTAMYQRIQQFSSTMEEAIEQKKYDLLLPFQNKIIAAIKEVAKEEHFTYIFNKSILSYSAQGEDISDKVKKKLGM